MEYAKQFKDHHKNFISRCCTSTIQVHYCFLTLLHGICHLVPGHKKRKSKWKILLLAGAWVKKTEENKYKKYFIYNKFKYKIQGFKTIGGQHNLWAKLLHRQTQMQITTEISNMLKHTKSKHCWKCTKIWIKRSLKSRHILCICKQ